MIDSQPVAKADPRQAFLDAAERLLVEVGHAGITTRRLAEEAGLNNGLIHYYFGSMENVLAETLDRFTKRLIERQRDLYSGPGPFLEKWRTAMSFMDVDQRSGYQKIWLELHAMAWNHPELRERVARVTAEWRSVLHSAIENAAREFGRDPNDVPVTALTALVETFSLGTMLERHIGVTEGHAELIAAIDGWLQKLKEESGDAGTVPGR